LCSCHEKLRRARLGHPGDTEGLLRARISELESNVIQCNEETAEARQRAELSRTTAQQLSTESTALAKTVSELRKSRADAQRSADALAAQVESLERAAAAHQSELDRALGLAKGRQAEIEQMHTLFSHLDATRAELVETLRRERAGAAQTESGLQELRTRHEETVQQLSRKEQEHEQALVTLRKLDAERECNVGESCWQRRRRWWWCDHRIFRTALGMWYCDWSGLTLRGGM
jgi:chromosome segregation ATPase